MNGVINVLKPPMMTSNSVISAIKRITGESHVGHTGTLDPNASGVLPICLGKSTKLAEYFLADEKEYVGEILFGNETDSCDTEGNVISSSAKIPTKEEFQAVLTEFTGDITQQPPVFSAIKINGKKAYELARSNVQVQIPDRKVFISKIELLSQPDHNRFVIRVQCSKGTYIRSLARDIARKLNSSACLSMLVRTRSGKFSIEDCVTIDEVKNAFEQGDPARVLLDPSQTLLHLPSAEFSQKYEKKLLCGNAVPKKLAIKCDNVDEASVIKIICENELIALAKLVFDENGNEIIQPTKVIAQ